MTERNRYDLASGLSRQRQRETKRWIERVLAEGELRALRRAFDAVKAWQTGSVTSTHTTAAEVLSAMCKEVYRDLEGKTQ